jgi:NAD(P) transhydrogenase subunit alpha
MEKKDLVIGVPREIFERCRCVAVVPQVIKTLILRGHALLVERNAGAKAYYPDGMYEETGARLIADASGVYGEADVIMKIRPPLFNKTTDRHELDMMKGGATILSFLAPLQNSEVVPKLVEKKLTGFAMELVPRVARAQGMDALSTFACISGYRAALLAASSLGKFLPGLTTSAGTIQPANVLVIGAGLAGLQAVATLHRLGACVEAFDVRPAVKEQVHSVGGHFLEIDLPSDSETSYGYARELSHEIILREREVIAAHLPKSDVVIATALAYGRKAPVLVTEDMVKMMSPGSVIIDIVAEQGGNCELTRAGETIEKYGVTVHGAVELPSQMPQHTSLLYSRNVTAAFDNLYSPRDASIRLEDEVNREALVTCHGVMISGIVKGGRGTRTSA